MIPGGFPPGSVPIAGALEGMDFSQPGRFQQLIGDPDAARIYLVELKAWTGAGEETFYFAKTDTAR